MQKLDKNLDIIQGAPFELAYLDGDLNIIQKLDDEPNDVGGLTSAELKETFDRSGNIIKEYINNDLVPNLDPIVQNEKSRCESENERRENEQERVSNEEERASAEQARDIAETARDIAEQARDEAEKQRAAAYPSVIQTVTAAKDSAVSAAESAQAAKSALEQSIAANPGSTVIDPTLSVAGAAAEAVAVGQLKSDNAYNIAREFCTFVDLPASASVPSYGASLTWNEDNTVCTINGTPTEYAWNKLHSSSDGLGLLKAGEMYYFDVVSSEPNYASLNVFYAYDGVLDSANPQYITKPKWITIPENASGVLLRVGCVSNITYNDTTVSFKIFPRSFVLSEIDKRLYSKDAEKYAHDGKITLSDIVEDGFYVINTNLVVTDAPENFSPSGLKVENYSSNRHGRAWVKQTIEDIVTPSNKTKYIRIFGNNFEIGEWVDVSPKQSYTNNYVTNHYENAYTISCTPEITTDVNNYLKSTGDATDMTGAIQTMLNTNKICRLGPGVFYVTGVTLPTGGMLVGSGNSTRVILADSITDGYAVKIGTYGCVKDLMIGGSRSYGTKITGITSVVGTRHGVIFEGLASSEGPVPYRSTIHNVTFYNLTGGAITCTNTGFNYASSLNVSDVFAFWCGVGINIAYFSEFNRFTNVNVDGCYYGCINNGGNNVFVNCGFSGNTEGLLMDNSTGQSRNSSHGSFVGCVFNHSGNNSGIAIHILGMVNGEIFDGCQLFYGKVVIDSCTGIRFIGLNMGRETPVFISNSTSILFSDCLMRKSENTPVTITNSINIRFDDCYCRDGTSFTGE